jgi:hypothetical protein
MNSKLTLSATCCAALLLTASLAVGAPRGGGHGGHFSGMSARSGHSFSRGGMGIAGGRHWSGGNWSGRNWSGRNWSGRNWSGRNWSGRNWNNWNGNWRHHHHHHDDDDNDFIFIGSFGFPFWGWGYPYGYYGYGYPYGYGYGYGYNGYGYGYGQSGYGYGYGNRSRVAELQRRLARAGYYGGAIDGIMGPQTRRAIRAYQRNHGYAG